MITKKEEEKENRHDDTWTANHIYPCPSLKICPAKNKETRKNKDRKETLLNAYSKTYVCLKGLKCLCYDFLNILNMCRYLECCRGSSTLLQRKSKCALYVVDCFFVALLSTLKHTHCVLITIILNEWPLLFIASVEHPPKQLTLALFGCYMAGAKWNCCCLSMLCVHHATMSYHFM